MARKFDLVAAILIVQAFYLVGRVATDFPSVEQDWLMFDRNDLLGAEYDDIARSIYAGKGFASPFQVPSGPTAWMPPVLAYIQAGLYWVTGGDRDSVVSVILVLKGAVLFLTAWIVLSEARRLKRWWTGLILLVVVFATNFHELFRFTHDIWLILAAVNLIWLGCLRLDGVKAALPFVAWGVLGGIIALCSPIAGATWAIATIVICSRQFRQSVPRKPIASIRNLLLAAAVSIVVVLPWSIRNRVVLGKWIPVKSNVMYEVWLSTCLDDDGVLDLEAQKQHPWGHHGSQRKRYLKVGEIAFLEELKVDAMSAIRGDPVEVFKGIGRRFVAATLVYTPIANSYESQFAKPIRFKRLVFWVPFACWICLLTWQRPSRNPRLLYTLVIYGAFLVPYILISYYDRYGAPLVTIKILLMLYGADAALACFTHSSPEKQQSEPQHS